MYGMNSRTKPKTIAFDFDKKISDHPTLFLEVMETFERFGWFVVVVTYRTPSTYPDDLDFLLLKGYKVFFTSHTAKDKYMKSLGIDIDIWVDDEPETIIRSYKAVSGVFYD